MHLIISCPKHYEKIIAISENFIMLAFNVIMHLDINALISIFQWLNPSFNRESKVRMRHKYFHLALLKCSHTNE